MLYFFHKYRESFYAEASQNVVKKHLRSLDKSSEVEDCQIWEMNLLFEISLARVMSPEFTREAVMKFLPAPFSWIWCKCLLRNLIHSKIF